MVENILSISNVSKKYKGFNIQDITFELPKGYIMGFIGPNGAGKSTTIKMIMNLVKKDSGHIEVFGLDSIKYSKEIKNRIGFVYDESYYYEDLKISEMKYIIKKFYKNWDEVKYNKYIREFGLLQEKKIKELSKGMKMKFSIAMALSHNAELLLMDEPTSGLDPVIRSEIMDILYNVIEDGEKSVFFSTHITSDLEKIADFITFINEGKIVFSDTKDNVMENYAILKGEKELIQYGINDMCVGIIENSFGFSALTKDKLKVLSTFKDKVLVEKPTLDEIMVFYKRSEQNV